MQLIKKISIGTIVAIFLALIRCLFEPFRLDSQNMEINFPIIKPFLIGGIISSFALLISGFFYLNKKYWISIITFVVFIVMMIITKTIFS